MDEVARGHERGRVGGEKVAVDEGIPCRGRLGSEESGDGEGAETGEWAGGVVAAYGACEVLHGRGVVGQWLEGGSDGSAGFEDRSVEEVVVATVVAVEMEADALCAGGFTPEGNTRRVAAE